MKNAALISAITAAEETMIGLRDDVPSARKDNLSATTEYHAANYNFLIDRNYQIESQENRHRFLANVYKGLNFTHGWIDNSSSGYSGNHTEGLEESLNGGEPRHWGVLALTSLIIATAIGNILVCLAVVWERRLQNMTNYFLMSLAIADLLVSILVMPLGMIVELYGEFVSPKLESPRLWF